MYGKSRDRIAKRLRLPRHAVVAAALCVASLLIAPAVVAKGKGKSEETYSPAAAIAVPGKTFTSFDISYDDPNLQLAFIADRSNAAIDVIDTANDTNHDTVIGQLTDSFTGITCPTCFDTAGPNGVLSIATNVWAGNGDSTVKVINLVKGPVASISTGGTKRADELCYDPRDNIVMMANDSEPISPPTGGGTAPFDTFISTTDYSVLGKLVMNGSGGAPLATNGIEQCQWSSRTGMFYQNIPEVNGPGNDTKPGAALVIDPVKEKIVKTFNLAIDKCEGPQGMAIGPQNQILIGCNDPNKDHPSTVVINLHSGAVERLLKGEDGSDEVWQNSGDGHYFLARSGGATGPQLGVVDADSGNLDPSATTATGAHSVTADAITNEVYVPIGGGAGTVCSSVPKSPVSDAAGCIAVYESNASEHGR